MTNESIQPNISRRIFKFVCDVLWQELAGAALISAIGFQSKSGVRFPKKFITTLKDPFLWAAVIGFSGFEHFVRRPEAASSPPKSSAIPRYEKLASVSLETDGFAKRLESKRNLGTTGRTVE